MNHPLRCRCGTIQGHVALPTTTARAVCYCKDCQAYARFLGRSADVLDAAGGTDVVAVMPSRVAFTQGQQSIVCMSLTPRGLLRWYSSCCSTPIGNTPRDRKVHYLGLVHSCLSAQQPLEPSFGPARVRVNTGSALRRDVGSTPIATFATVAKLGTAMLGARVSGRYRDNPFFDTASGKPVKAPRVLTAAELAPLKFPAAPQGPVG